MPHARKTIKLPVMTPGTTREIVYHRFGKAGARPKAYLQAAIHANELPGAMVLHHLMPMLVKADRAKQIKGEIIIVPAVNPIGLSQIVGNIHLGRYDFLGRENFNRNWLDLSTSVTDRVGERLGKNPAKNVATIRKVVLNALDEMEPANELAALRVEVMKLSADADIVLDMHCDQNSVLHQFISRTDWPGLASDLAADIGAEASIYNDPFPEMFTFSGVHTALWPRLATRFPNAQIPQACFSTTIEYRAQHDVSHALGAADAENLYRFLVRQRLIAGKPGPLPELKAGASPRGGMDVGYAPKTGILVFHKLRGERVRKGEAICEVIDPCDERGAKARTQVLARTDGLLFSRRLDGRLAWPGMVLFRVAGDKLLAHRKGLSGQDD